MPKSKINPDLIHLITVRVLKTNLELSDKMLDRPKKIEGFQIGTNSESSFNFEDKKMRFRLFLKLSGHNKQNKPVGIEGEYAIEFHYHIENLDDFLSKNEGEDEFSIGEDLGGTIASISYSTARGIILERTNGTDFNGIILPIINPKEILFNDPIQEKSNI